jgi:hypothetical protein
MEVAFVYLPKDGRRLIAHTCSPVEEATWPIAYGSGEGEFRSSRQLFPIQAAVASSPIARPASPSRERFALEQEEGYAEYVVRRCLFLTALIGLPAFPGQIFEIVLSGEAEVGNQPG